MRTGMAAGIALSFLLLLLTLGAACGSPSELKGVVFEDLDANGVRGGISHYQD